MACKRKIPRKQGTRVLHSVGEDKKHEPYRIANYLETRGIRASVRVRPDYFNDENTYELVVPSSEYARAKKFAFGM